MPKILVLGFIHLSKICSFYQDADWDFLMNIVQFFSFKLDIISLPIFK